jgi:hypothetical protein
MKVHGKTHVYQYVPEFFNNRKLDAEEQIVLGLKVVPLKEYDDYQRACMLTQKKFSVDKSQELNEKRFNALIEEKFVSCEGLEIDGRQGGITFQTIYEEIPELAQEIIKAVMSTEILTAGELKNFLPESDGASSAPAKGQKATTARSATKGPGK